MPYSFSTFRTSKRGQPLYKGQTAEFIILSPTCPSFEGSTIHVYYTIQAVLDTIFLGNLTLVPHHTVILDKTQCDLPHIVTVAPPTAPPPPTSPPSSATDTCLALYDIIRKAHSEQFFCKAKKDCETGILCTLEILDTFYTVNITLISEDKTIIFSVTDSNQEEIGSAKSKNSTVSLPKPTSYRTSLIFNQRLSVDKGSTGSIGFSVNKTMGNAKTEKIAPPSSMSRVYTSSYILLIVD